MRNFLVIVFLVMSSSLFAQVSITAGPSMLLGTVRDAKPWFGFQVGLEIPRDDQVTLYGRFTHHFKQFAPTTFQALLTPKDPNDFNFPVVNGRTSMNYNILEGGTRYYLGNGFDFGWAAYGGSNIMIIISSVKDNYESFDETKYTLDPSYRYNGTIFGLGFGLGGGLKYTFPRLGTIYTDLNANYIVLPASSTPPPSGELYSSLIFNFNIGYRRDIIW